LDELGFVGRGKSRHRPRNDVRLYGGPYPFIQTAEIMAADPYITAYSQTYSEFGLQQSKMWPPNTLCLTIAGANTAKNAILRFEACFPDSVVGFIPDNDKSDLHFIKYSLDLMRHRFLSVSRGATQDNLSLDKLLSFPLLVPEVQEQRRIAGILSAFDDLIENSQRRIKILEEMARRLYREWFVYFRFPGHKGCRFVESPLGEIPEVWEVAKLEDISSYINRGITPRYDEMGDSVVLNQKCVRHQRLNFEPARRQAKPIPPEKQIRFGDVLINSTGVGTLGRVAQVYTSLESCTVDTHVTIARAAPDIDLDFYGCCLLGNQEVFERLGVGATGQTELSRNSIASIELVMPPSALQCQFGAIVSGLRLSAEIYLNQIQNLRRTRDLLLPRLVSGQIDVEALPEPVLTES
jgi:type I restriction enzyme S subunit